MIKKLLMMLCLFLLIGCDKTFDVTEVDMKLIRKNHDYSGYAIGYIFETQEDSILVVNESISDQDNKYGMLGAFILRMDENKIEEMDLKVGQKIKYKTNGLVLTMYPGITSIEEVDLIEDNYESKYPVEEVVKRIIEVFEKILTTDDGMYICINSLVLENNIWEAKVVIDQADEDKLLDYKIYIDDETLEVVKLEYYKVQ